MRKFTKLALWTLAALLVPAAEALGAAHAMGIVHVHEHVRAVSRHVHEDGHSHDHSSLVVASAPFSTSR